MRAAIVLTAAGRLSAESAGNLELLIPARGAKLVLDWGHGSAKVGRLARRAAQARPGVEARGMAAEAHRRRAGGRRRCGRSMAQAGARWRWGRGPGPPATARDDAALERGAAGAAPPRPVLGGPPALAHPACLGGHTPRPRPHSPVTPPEHPPRRAL